MRWKLSALAMLLAVVWLAASSSFGATVLFEDKFATLDPGWGMAGKIIYAKDGKFVISPEMSHSQAVINQGNLFPNNMDVSVTVNFATAGAPSFGSGLIFWANDYSDYYALLVTTEGWLVVQRYVAGRTLTPVTWRPFDAIKKGQGADNMLRVVTNGNQGTAYINDQMVVTFSGQPPQGGSLVGLKAASGDDAVNVVTFADLKVVQP
jgi:hypothetical protein